MPEKLPVKGPKARPRPGAKVLVVDDDAQVLGFLTQVLREGGYAVTGTTSGKEAMEILPAQGFDLMVLDLEMPEFDGFDILKLARSRRLDVRIIVISGYLDGALLNAATLLGADSAIQKPVTARELLSKVGEAIGEAPKSAAALRKAR